ncbi:hypothetical protein PIB30_044545 [Stylosanthes scabra]|uniref:Uncharacterized protein n=1 Tax=Stylosanthes scabra TaxID=79078 RepID=A0ABU6TGN4_9FABA|nr:hypothetical protein [Stylosanthes scabra]
MSQLLKVEVHYGTGFHSNGSSNRRQRLKPGATMRISPANPAPINAKASRRETSGKHSKYNHDNTVPLIPRR